MFYRNTVATESESVQRLGIVRVGYFHQRYPRGGPDQELIRMSVQMIEAVPIRSVAFYLVAGSNLWSQTVELIVLLARPWLRVRTRILNGACFCFGFGASGYMSCISRCPTLSLTTYPSLLIHCPIYLLFPYFPNPSGLMMITFQSLYRILF